MENRGKPENVSSNNIKWETNKDQSNFGTFKYIVLPNNLVQATTVIDGIIFTGIGNGTYAASFEAVRSLLGYPVIGDITFAPKGTKIKNERENKLTIELADDPTIWAPGKTIEEALGELVCHHRVKISIEGKLEKKSI
jgi:hypothetical protein